SSRRRHTRSKRDWSSDVCSSDLQGAIADPLVYNCDNKKTARKERRKLWFERQKRAYLAILKTSLSEHLPKYPNLQQKVVQLVHKIGRASCRERGYVWELERQMTR